MAVPLIWSMWPSARAKAAGAPVEVDLSRVEPGMQLTVEWRGAPVWVLHRTPKVLDGLTERANALLADRSPTIPNSPDYAKNPHRSRDQISGGQRGLHPSGVLADAAQGNWRSRSGRRLAGRLLLPLPQSSSTSRRGCSRACLRPTNTEVPSYTIAGTMLVIGADSKREGLTDVSPGSTNAFR